MSFVRKIYVRTIVRLKAAIVAQVRAPRYRRARAFEIRGRERRASYERLGGERVQRSSAGQRFSAVSYLGRSGPSS